MATKTSDTAPARQELQDLMKVCPASVRVGGYGHVIKFKRALADGYRALGNSRATAASLRATTATLRSSGA